MELRERYDPEDIESLLSERAFDELLDDERTFVLRHVSGREEYERMRALLRFVRPDEHERTPIEAEERVRRNVLAAFHEQQVPRWKIWLNTVAAWAAPREASAFWRPALAFGTLALLIVAGVIAVRQFDEKDARGLAEVVPAKVQEEPSTPPSNLEARTEQSAADSEATSGALVRGSLGARDAEVKNDASGVLVDAQIRQTAMAEADRSVAADDAVAEEVAMDKAITKDLQFTDLSPTAPATSHVVTADELARNFSLTNEVGTIQVEGVKKDAAQKEQASKAKTTASRKLTQDPDLLVLATAGW